MFVICRCLYFDSAGSVVLDDILVNIFRLLRRFYSADNDRQLASNSQMSTYKLAQSLDIRFNSQTTKQSWLVLKSMVISNILT